MINKVFLVLLLAAPLSPLAANAETVYLIIKTRGSGQSRVPALLSVPMTSMEDCEEAGARIITSKRFDIDYASEDAFECLSGK